MNRFLRAAAVAAILPLGLASAGCHSTGTSCAGGGCGTGGGHGNGSGSACGDKYRNCVDVAWPERYNYAARQAVVAPFAQQVANGHFLHQSLWNFYFEPGTDKLTPGGMEKLDSVARTTPSPDPRLYIQTAHDLGVTPDNQDKAGALRNELNGKRAMAIKRYMATQFGPAIEYEVYVHDAPVPSIYSAFAAAAYRGQLSGYQGGLTAGSIGIGSVGGGSGSGLPAGNSRTSSSSTNMNTNTTVTGGSPVP